MPDQQHPHRVREESEPDDDRHAERAYQTSTDLSAEDDEDTGGKLPPAVLRRRQEPRALQEDGQHEAQSELAHREHETGQQAVAVRLDLEVREREERVLVA